MGKYPKHNTEQKTQVTGEIKSHKMIQFMQYFKRRKTGTLIF